MKSLQTYILENESKMLIHCVTGNAMRYGKYNDLFDIFKDIRKNGLVPRNNGEDTCVWFSTDGKFYDTNNAKLVFGIEPTKENIEKYDMKVYSSISKAYNKIPFDALTVINCPIAKSTSDHSLWDDLIWTMKDFTWNHRSTGSSTIKRMTDNGDLNEIVIYKDLWDEYVKDDGLYKLDNPNIKIINELK